MNSDYRLTPLSLIQKFDLISNRLAKDRRNVNLDEAIISWCIELSLEKHFPKISQEIIADKNLWIQHKTVLEITLKLYQNLLVITDRRSTRGLGNLTGNLNNISFNSFYYNTQETIQKMSIKSVIFVAFIFTGIGLLLYLLKRKNNNTNSLITLNGYSENIQYIQNKSEKYILVLLINSDRNSKLIDSLDNSKYLDLEHGQQLYDATKYLWKSTKTQFEDSEMKKWFKSDSLVDHISESEYDVNFIKIELGSNDSRFNPDVNPMDRRDAFIELSKLGKRSPQITVSPRLSCKAYENTEFYSR